MIELYKVYILDKPHFMHKYPGSRYVNVLDSFIEFDTLNDHRRSLLGKFETPDDLFEALPKIIKPHIELETGVKKGYGAWVSPYGDVYPAETYEHLRIAAELCITHFNLYKLTAGAFLEEKGWVYVGASGRTRSTYAPTYDQENALIDIMLTNIEDTIFHANMKGYFESQTKQEGHL